MECRPLLARALLRRRSLAGLSTGAGIGGGMPAMPPTAPASPSPALSPGGAAAPAAAAGGGVSPAAAQPGMVAPAAPAAPAGAGMGSGAPMMLPPGSMGPPAGAVPPPAAPTMPAGTIGGGSNAPSSAAPPSSAGGGATLIPASVVAAGQTAAARERRESADAAAAKELAWKLQYAAEWVNYIGMDWAVGVFRSPSGTETVITSNDGASFIPAGVYVPRSVRVLAADPLVDDHFRQLWFGWHDPARVLVEYARIRSETGWRLVAAATTGAVTALRDAGVEHPPSCSRDVNPLLRPGERPVAPPTLDGLHVHRLSLLWPDMYPRLLRVMEAHPVYQDRIVNAVSALMLNAATTQAVAVEGGIPDAFRRIWSMRGSPREPSAQEWAAYDAAGPELQHACGDGASRFHERRHRPQRDDRRPPQLPGALAGCANSRSHRRLVDATTSAARHGVRRHRSRHGASPRTDRRRGAGRRRGSGPRAAMTSSYIWELRQQRARHQYGFARYMLLKPILMDARTGTLDPNWRQGLSTALSWWRVGDEP